MQGLPVFNPRSDAPKRRDEPGKGDDVPCVKCGGALDTGLECTECGHDNYEAVTGKPFKQPNASLEGCGAAGGASLSKRLLGTDDERNCDVE